MRFAEVLDSMTDGEVMAMREGWPGGVVTIGNGHMTFTDGYGTSEYMAPAEDVLADDWVII